MFIELSTNISHNTLAILTLQIMCKNSYGGRTEESSDNSQLVMGFYRLEEPNKVVTVPRVNSPSSATIIRQLEEGNALATRSFYDERSIESIATEFAERYNGTGGSLTPGEFRCMELATSSKERILREYFSSI